MAAHLFHLFSRRLRCGAVLLAFLAAWAGFVTGVSPVSAERGVAATTVTIHITGSARPPGFSPSLLTVHVGDSIVFVNDSIPPASYSVIASDHSFSSPAIAPGQQWKVTMNKQGAHEYHDPRFAQQMVGELLVVSTAIDLLPTPAPGAVARAIGDIRDERGSAATPPYPLIGAIVGGSILILLLIVLLGARLRRKSDG